MRPDGLTTCESRVIYLNSWPHGSYDGKGLVRKAQTPLPSYAHQRSPSAVGFSFAPEFWSTKENGGFLCSLLCYLLCGQLSSAPL
jgi:hypothetical protein